MVRGVHKNSDPSHLENEVCGQHHDQAVDKHNDSQGEWNQIKLAMPPSTLCENAERVKDDDHLSWLFNFTSSPILCVAQH